MLSYKNHFLFFVAPDPDVNFFSSRNCLENELRKVVHLVLHSETIKKKKVEGLIVCFIYNTLICYMYLMNEIVTQYGYV